MSNAPQRMAFDGTKLTPAQQLVLLHMARQRGPNGWMARASRQIAVETGLTRPTVQTAINRLNELQYIYTRVGNTQRPSKHFLLVDVSELSERGQIKPPRKKPPQSDLPKVRSAVAGGAR